MVHRRHGSIPSFALWGLVAVGDLALVVANLGITVLIALCTLATAGVAARAFGASAVKRTHQRVPATSAVPLKRNA